MEKRYTVGEYVVHENNGVCKVREISEKALQGRGSERLYYSLEPVFSKGSAIITPVDTKVRIRDVSSPEEIQEIFDILAEIPIIEEENSRVRGELYKEELSRFDIESLAGVLKTVYLRKELRIAQGKKVMSSDEKVYAIASKKLFEEIAFVTGRTMDDIEADFFGRLETVKDEYIKDNVQE